MRRAVIAAVVVASVGGVASSALVARQPPQAPNVPGMPTQARTLIINGVGEPVPVVIGNGGQVQPVTIVGTPSVVVTADSAITTRAGRQAWEYRAIPLPAGQDAAAVLNAAGAEGWEAVGVTTGAVGASQVLLKRPR
jgi:hypothetical protein